MLCPQFAPLVGGYERAAERLSAELVRQGHEVTVLTERRDPAWPPDEGVLGFHIHRLRICFRPGWHGLTSFLAHVVWLLRFGRRFDVWHAHQYGSRTTIAVLLGHALRRPVVLKLTSTARQGIGSTLAQARLDFVHRWAHRHVSACIAVSDEAAAEAVAFGIPAKVVHRIGNGLDKGVFQPATPAERSELRTALGLPDRSIALFVGRLAVEKNPIGAVRAWSQAAQRLAGQWLLVIVGDGPQHSDVVRAIESERVQDSVLLAGKRDRVQDWYRAADLFILSSLNEGLANTVLEAMACGLAVVATRVSGVKELVEDVGAGMVVPAGDMDALGTSISKLAVDNKERREMGARARRLIEKQFTIQSITAQHLAVYRALVGR